MKAVFDTSVLFSAFLKKQGATGQILDLAEKHQVRIVISEPILQEAGSSLLRQRSGFRHSPEAVESYLAGLRTSHEVLSEVPEIEPVCRDPDDDHVLAAALAANADLIVTGDKDLLVLEEHEGIRIVSVRAFVDMLEETSA